jgi:hypothetical protein
MKDYGPGFSCSKRFPRPHMEKTVIDEHSYPSYRRRANRFSTTSKDPLDRRETVTVGNKLVVPYNLYLCKKYKAHINVEIRGTIRAIRYIHKYVYRGSDHATIELDASVDEIKQYVNCRYLGSSEGICLLRLQFIGKNRQSCSFHFICRDSISFLLILPRHLTISWELLPRRAHH